MRWIIIEIASMTIDGPSMPIGKSCDVHRRTIDDPSMGYDGPIDGIEWNLSTGSVSNCDARTK